MVDILTKTSTNEKMMKQEEMEDFEDGELVEEGEICDDEDDEPEQKPGLLQPPVAASQASPPNGHPSSSPTNKKPSREELAGPKPVSSEAAWKPQQQSHHDDGFGFGDRDFRSMGSSEDKDYRWNEGPPNGAGAEDFDFRDRRRRHSPSPPAHLKRARPSPPHGPFADEGPPMMGGGRGHPHFAGRGGFRGRGRGGGFGAPRWMERHICKFFREGYCRDGDHCTYSHQAEDSKRRPEVCKFYLSGHCKKGLACHHLHGEFPCKAFHKGECTKDPCQFSHQPLNDYTRPMFDQQMRDEQFSQRLTMPPAPVRRRVLLPGGPVPGQPLVAAAPNPAVNPAAVAAAQAAAAIVTQGLVAPPGVTPGPFPPGYKPGVAGAAATAPIPIAVTQSPSLESAAAALPPPSVVVPRLSAPAMSSQMLQQQQPAAAVPAAIPLPTQQSAAPAPSAAASSAAAAAAAAGGFNISFMLAQIAGTMPGGAGGDTTPMGPTEEELESPESPPMAPPMPGDIPLPFASSRDTTLYRLRPVDRETPYSGVSSAIISTASQQSDPRIARLLASQFDAVSSMIAAQQAGGGTSPATAPAAAPAARPVDPRAAARGDPRRDPRTARDTDQRVSWMPQMS